MQTFAEFMADSFRSSARLSWDLSGSAHVTAAFSVDAVRVLVTFEQREDAGPWHVLFEVQRGEGSAIAYAAFSIFNGVFQAVEEFIRVREPGILVFATKRDELAGIYQTYLKRESAAIEKLGYTLEGPVRVEPYMEFILRRIMPSGWNSDS